jgi:hypothetical protein
MVPEERWADKVSPRLWHVNVSKPRSKPRLVSPGENPLILVILRRSWPCFTCWHSRGGKDAQRIKVHTLKWDRWFLSSSSKATELV